MSFNSQHLRSAIVQTLEGTHSTVRDMAPGVLRHGVFDGQKPQAVAAKIGQGTLADGFFDVSFTGMRKHPSSPMSALSNKRLMLLGVRIPIWFQLPTEAQEAERVASQVARASALDDAVQALHYPRNLAETATADATNLVSGMLFGDDSQTQEPTVIHIDDDWDSRIAQYQIDAVGVVIITQVTT